MDRNGLVFTTAGDIPFIACLAFRVCCNYTYLLRSVRDSCKGKIRRRLVNEILQRIAAKNDCFVVLRLAYT